MIIGSSFAAEVIQLHEICTVYGGTEAGALDWSWIAGEVCVLMCLKMPSAFFLAGSDAIGMKNVSKGQFLHKRMLFAILFVGVFLNWLDHRYMSHSSMWSDQEFAGYKASDVFLACRWQSVLFVFKMQARSLCGHSFTLLQPFYGVKQCVAIGVQCSSDVKEDKYDGLGKMSVKETKGHSDHSFYVQAEAAMAVQSQHLRPARPRPSRPTSVQALLPCAVDDATWGSELDESSASAEVATCSRRSPRLVQWTRQT